MKTLRSRLPISIERYAIRPFSRKAYPGLRLDMNECLSAPNPRVIEAVVRALRVGEAAVYPEYRELLEEVADYVGVEARNILLVNGTETVLGLVLSTFVPPSSTVIVPEPTFPFFRRCVTINGNVILAPSYSGKRMDFPFEETLEMVRNVENLGLVVLCSPNNPTGTVLGRERIENLVRRAEERGCIVFLDEANAEFARTSAVDLVETYPNLIISRTFSKAFGLAGLRLGYLVASSGVVNELLKLRSPFDANILAVVAAQAALQSREYMEGYVAEVMERAKPLLEDFLERFGVSFFPSQANFLLCCPPDAAALAERLEKKGVLVRLISCPGVEDKLRITIGSVRQTESLIRTLGSCL